MPRSPRRHTTPPDALTSACLGIHRGGILRSCDRRANLTPVSSLGGDPAPQRVRDRRRLVRHRGRQGAAPAGLRLRLLREVRPRRRHLGLQEPQRDVGGVPLAAHQHLARADGVRRLPDAEVVSRLPAPHPHRRVLRRLRRPLRLPRADHVRDRRRARGAGRRRHLGGHARRRPGAPLRRADGGQRPPLGPALAGAGLPGHGRVRRPPAARARVHGRRSQLLPRQAGRSARNGQLGDGHRGRVELLGGRHLPGRAARRVGDAQVRVRAPARPDLDPGRRAVLGPPAVHADAAADRGRRHAALRAAEARPPAARGASDRLGRHPLARGARRGDAEAEHRAADRAHASCSPTAARSRPTSSSTAPATRSRSRSSTRR